MKPRTIIKGHLHSPYFIFVRASGRLTDADVLKLLGLDDFAPIPPCADWSKPHVYLIEDTAWIPIADDWLYSLWHKGHDNIVGAFHKHLPEISIFARFVGDADRPFDFTYYSSGGLLRRYVVEDPRYDKQRHVVMESFGQPLSLEKELSEIGDEQDYVLSLATSVGVKIGHDLASIRCYSRRDNRTEQSLYLFSDSF
jgi:hypothetical protein